jgi:hypothetical protein
MLIFIHKCQAVLIVLTEQFSGRRNANIKLNKLFGGLHNEETSRSPNKGFYIMQATVKI